ncbi:hypothetical protein P171DRAFT_443562 [Karstenula rhodostoma CBS 690.94]|uniref:FAD dependent oxidoreductase domain-containing protein n=1 Tax=Karstenula rhodostoma CBS 690.94 TaxID=1392251 RepID=A0A9P4UD61_9PLEO|nr:hypothetical protein P171DRAFT_443562 [Karstenula rhodostoma CBS 690.94]
MRALRRFVAEYLPELADENIEIEITRVCWYTDSFDNHFFIDYVPDTRGLFVATGGSGHAFKYIPNHGNWVVDVIEGVRHDQQFKRGGGVTWATGKPLTDSWRIRKVRGRGEIYHL